MNNKELVILAGKKQGGGSVTPASIVTATGQMTAQQAADTLGNIGGEPEKLVVTVTEANGVYSADKTYEEITDAINAGKICVAICGDDKYYLSNDEEEITFTVSRQGLTGQLTVKSIRIFDDNTCTLVVGGYTQPPATVTVSGTTPTIEPAPNTIYSCGELTSLTITDPPATGSYVIKFTSGSTATTTTIPASIIFPEAFAAEANTRYEINVEDGYAVAVGWPVS